MTAMNRLDPADTVTFHRRYRFAGGRVRRIRWLLGRKGKLAIEFVLSVHTATRELGTDASRVRLRLRLEGVQEYRFQKRPDGVGGRIAELRVGYLDGLFFLNLDAWGLEPGETPKVHDFRASEAYAAGSELCWVEI